MYNESYKDLERKHQSFWTADLLNGAVSVEEDENKTALQTWSCDVLTPTNNKK